MDNSKEKQIFKMQKDGLEKIANQIKGDDIKNVLTPIARLAEVLLGEAKGPEGKTPEKGKDYLTDEEKEEFVQSIMTRVRLPKDGIDGKDGRDGVDGLDAEAVDYEKIEDFVKKEVAKIPRPKNGVNGKDALPVNNDYIIDSILKKIPKPKDPVVDYELLKKFCFDEIRKMEEARGAVRQLQSGGPTTALGDVSDVEISGIQVGQSIMWDGAKFIPYTTSESATMIFSETPSGSGTAFTLLHTPVNNSLRLYRGGARQMPVEDYTLSGDDITLLNSLVPGEILLADYQY